MTQDIQKLHALMIQMDLSGHWYTAQVLRDIILSMGDDDEPIAA